MLRRVLGLCLATGALAANDAEAPVATFGHSRRRKASGSAGPGSGEDSDENVSTPEPIGGTSSTTTTSMWTMVSLCVFEDEPRTQYFWDPSCTETGVDPLGCKADGEHQECRFCGDGWVDCPTCAFEDEPETKHVWDNKCKPGEYTKGCFADGVHFECRFCGEEDLDPCPTTTTTTTETTTTTTEESEENTGGRTGGAVNPDIPNTEAAGSLRGGEFSYCPRRAGVSAVLLALTAGIGI